VQIAVPRDDETSGVQALISQGITADQTCCRCVLTIQHRANEWLGVSVDVFLPSVQVKHTVEAEHLALALRAIDGQTVFSRRLNAHRAAVQGGARMATISFTLQYMGAWTWGEPNDQQLGTLDAALKTPTLCHLSAQVGGCGSTHG
jgi:hypothetical protein